jgi:drug/metabolite transporter (DMT)-like permease
VGILLDHKACKQLGKQAAKLSHRQAVALMVLITFMWALAGVVTRHLEQARSFEITFWRSVFTALSLLVILPLWRGPGVFAALPWRSRVFWLSGVCWSVMFTAFMIAMALTTVANVLVTLSVGPLLTAVFARVFTGHRLPLRTGVAIVVAGVGIAYMQWGQLGIGAGWIGFLVALCVPVAGALQWTLVHYTQHGDKRAGEDQADGGAVSDMFANSSVNAAAPAVDLVPCVLIGALLSCLYTLPFALPLRASAHDLGLLAFLGLVQLAIPCVLSVLCATVLKAPEVSLLQLLEVIFGITLAWVGANEVPGPTVLVGGALVIGALVANELLGSLRKP